MPLILFYLMLIQMQASAQSTLCCMETQLTQQKGRWHMPQFSADMSIVAHQLLLTAEHLFYFRWIQLPALIIGPILAGPILAVGREGIVVMIKFWQIDPEPPPKTVMFLFLAMQWFVTL